MKIYNKGLPNFPPGPVMVDLESNGLNPFRPEAKIWCFGVAQDPDEIYWVRVRKEDIPKYRAFFEKHPILAHRATFESMWIEEHFGVSPRIYFDTKVGEFLIDENSPTGLKYAAIQHLKVEPWADIENFDKIEDWHKLKIYNCRDISYSLRLYRERHLPHLKRFTKKAKLLKYVILPAIEVFSQIIVKGFHIDEELATERLGQCDENMELFRNKIAEVNKGPINPGSPKQIVQLLYTDLGLKCSVKTKKGANSSSEAALIRLAGKHPVLDDILEWRKWKKYASAYLIPWLNKGPILHANYGFTDTDTGRLNSKMVGNKRREKKLGGNLHQCPRDPFIRTLITPRYGDEWCIVAGDLGQAELRLAAHAANERTMIAIFNLGADTHHILAFHTPGMPFYRGDKCPECDIHLSTASGLVRGDINEETRKKAKAVNFGFLYGMWAKKFVAYAKEKFGLNLSLQDGERYREQYFNKYPDLELWYNRVEAQIRGNGWIDSVFGRRRHLPGAKYGSDYPEWMVRELVRQAINSPIQSAASDLTLFIAALIASKSLKWTFKINPEKVFFIGSAHDSLLSECRRDYAKELKEGIDYTIKNLPMFEYFGVEFKVPIIFDVDAYSDRWKGNKIKL